MVPIVFRSRIYHAENKGNRSKKKQKEAKRSKKEPKEYNFLCFISSLVTYRQTNIFCESSFRNIGERFIRAPTFYVLGHFAARS